MEPKTPQYRKLPPNVLAVTVNRLARRLRDAERTGRGLAEINAILDGDIVQVKPTDPNATRVMVTITRAEYVAEFGEEPPSYRQAVEDRNRRIEAGYQKRLATLAAHRGDPSVAGSVRSEAKTRAARQNGAATRFTPKHETPEAAAAAHRASKRESARRRRAGNAETPVKRGRPRKAE